MFVLLISHFCIAYLSILENAFLRFYKFLHVIIMKYFSNAKIHIFTKGIEHILISHQQNTINMKATDDYKARNQFSIWMDERRGKKLT